AIENLQLLRLLAASERGHGRNKWKRVRIQKEKGLLRGAVETLRLQFNRLRDAIVENAAARAENGLSRLGRRATDAPRHSNARRPVAIVMNVGLRFVAQAIAQR